jgi:hypothetical protein
MNSFLQRNDKKENKKEKGMNSSLRRKNKKERGNYNDIKNIRTL